MIRRFLGHARYSGQVAGQTIAHFHGAMRLYVNYFQPSFKLMEKTRKGSVVTKRYSPPATPCERVLQHEMVGAEAKASLNERGARLDPVALLHSIRETQSALAAIVAPEVRPTPRGESLERFLARLPDRWRQNEEAASRPKKVRAPPALGEHGRTPLRVCGVEYWSGCRWTRTPARWHCWIGCSQLIRTGSKGPTCGLCSGGCNNGGASWRANWSSPFPARLHGTNIHCRNWRWLQVVPSAEISVTSFSEAIGVGRNADAGQRPSVH